MASDYLNKLVNKLQSMRETPFTKDVLIPLLQKLGYERVHYHGGPYEIGKDVVCWSTDRFGGHECTVVQVKRYQPSAASADKHSFAGVVTQLQQAVEQPIPHTDGHTYLPAEVVFVTPYAIDTRALQTRFDGYAALRGQRVKVVDGPALCSLLQSHLPELAGHLLGVSFNVNEVGRDYLDNADLLGALDSHTKLEMSSFYCDLNFSLGSNTTRFFLRPSAEPGQIDVVATPKEWSNLRRTHELCQKKLGTTAIRPSIEEVERQFNERAARHSKLRNDREELVRSSAAFRQRLSETIEKLLSEIQEPPPSGGMATESVRIDAQRGLEQLGAAIADYHTAIDHHFNRSELDLDHALFRHKSVFET